MAENINEVFWICTPDWEEILYISPKFEEVWGISCDHLMKNPISWFNSVLKQDRDIVLKEIKNKASGNFEDPKFPEYRIKRPDGSLRWIFARAYPIKDDNGNIQKIAGIAEDITERKKFEDQIRIRQKIESLGTLAGGIAHDFNNMLVGIMGSLDLLEYESTGLSISQKDYLKNAIVNCENAAELIRRFQSLSDAATTAKEKVDVFEIISESFMILKSSFDFNPAFNVKFKQGEYFIQANRFEMVNSFIYLGENSIDALISNKEETIPRINVYCSTEKISQKNNMGISDGDYLHIIFEDNGAGMTEDTINKAFDPLFSTKEKSSKRGQGLGLATVYNVVTKLHGGTVYIESELSKGTRIHIYIPATDEQAEDRSEDSSIDQRGAATILVVDDEEIILNMTEIMLDKLGYKVISANGGYKAIELFKDNRDKISVVILDLSMPEISGEEVLKEMIAINSNVKVVIASGNDNIIDTKKQFPNIRSIINKPFKISNLNKAIQEALSS
ncbi:response regulator [candidate division KSB1 bacterium]